MTIGLGVFLSSASASSLSAGSGSLTTRARRLLSGDQTWSDTPPLMSVILTASPPARLRSHTWPLFAPWRDDTNDRNLLSGLQRGDDSPSGVDVIWMCCVPSQLTIQTSVLFLSVSLTAVVTV